MRSYWNCIFSGRYWTKTYRETDALFNIPKSMLHSNLCWEKRMMPVPFASDNFDQRTVVVQLLCKFSDWSVQLTRRNLAEAFSMLISTMSSERPSKTCLSRKASQYEFPPQFLQPPQKTVPVFASQSTGAESFQSRQCIHSHGTLLADSAANARA